MLYYAQMAIAQTAVDVGGMNRPQGRLDATTALWPYQGSLNERMAAHLLRRAGFGGSPEEISRYSSMNVNTAVEQLVRYPQADAQPPTDLYSAASTLSQYGPRGLRQLGNVQRRDLNKEIVSNERGSLLSLQVWWLNRMLTSPAPLQEKMALYFHGHFTTAAIRKNVSPAMVYNQNQLYRQYALGNLRELTRNVAKDPAMLRYLDNDRNAVGEPNENFARELMELFTLGVDHYSEDDVRDSARAWTGWHYLLAAAVREVLRRQPAQPVRLQRPRTRASRRPRKRHPEERLQSRAGDVDVAAQPRVLLGSRLPCTGQESG
jgi:uncharacterized protein (DUF1800 family)